MKPLIILLLLVGSIHSQTLRNGKFYCKNDTSAYYEKEEWTLTLFEINVVELRSVKSGDVSHTRLKTKVKEIKSQFYTGYWEQKGDTIIAALDSNSDSMDIDVEYHLTFLFQKNNLILIKALQLKNFDYSDYFYKDSVWTKQRFRQKRKVKIRAKF